MLDFPTITRRKPVPKIYATIRKNSKYFHQQDFKGKEPVPFPVLLDFSINPTWPVKGGVGGNYQLNDIDLWIRRSDGYLLKIPMHGNPTRG
jgi:hypothetical protein